MMSYVARTRRIALESTDELAAAIFMLRPNGLHLHH
jgi:hypothetical protein